MWLSEASVVYHKGGLTMALEYRQVAFTSQPMIRESGSKSSSSPYHKRKRMNPVNILEEEIHLLRTLMEKTAEDEQSFTSEMVVLISSMLDKKINEYMKLNLKMKQCTNKQEN